MRRIHVIASSLFLCGVAPAANAQHHVEYGVNLSLGPHYIEHYEQGAEPVGEINHEDIIEGYGRVAGIANVGFGVNKARVDLSGTNPEDPLFFEYGFATSRYWDVIVFDDPDLNGTLGFFDVTLYMEGSGSLNLSENIIQSPDTEFEAFWHAVINVHADGAGSPPGTMQSVYYAGDWYKPWGGTTLEYTGDELNTYQQTATIEFVYGEPFLMDTFLQVDIFIDNQDAAVPGTLDCVIDLGNSAYWGGIRNLRDANGSPVEDAGYASSSGFDYRALPFAPSDVNTDGAVNVADLLILLGAWGPNPGHAADINGDGVVDVADLLTLLGEWG